MNVDNRSAGGPVDLFFVAGHVGVESVADYPGADSAVAKGDLKGMGVRTVTLRAVGRVLRGCRLLMGAAGSCRSNSPRCWRCTAVTTTLSRSICCSM